MTAIAAWMLVCIFFVFFALVGFVIIVIIIIVIIIIILFRYAYLLWKKKKSCLKRKKNKKQSEDEGKLRVARKEDYRSKVTIILMNMNLEEYVHDDGRDDCSYEYVQDDHQSSS